MADTGDTFDFSFDFAPGPSIGGGPDVQQALSLLNEARPEDALDSVDRARARDGATPLIRHLLALCVCRMGRVVPAIRLLRTAHDDAPQAYEHVEILASLLTVAGQRTEGVYFAKLATALKPAYPEYELVPSWLISFNTALLVAADNPIVENGYLLISDGALEKAADNFIDAIELDKSNAAAWEGLVEVSRRRNRPGDGLRASEALCELEPDNAKHLRVLAQCQVGIGDVAAGWQTVNQCLSVSNADPSMAQALPGLVRYDLNAPAGLMQDLSAAWNELAAVQPESPKVTQRPDENSRFRVGVLSGSIISKSERTALLSTIDECIGRAADLHYYSNTDVEDAVSRRFRRSAACWRDISRVDDETAAAIIKNDEIQVLIDLDGYDWSGRPGIVARRPAPVTLCLLATPGAVPGAQNGVIALGEGHLVEYMNSDAPREVLDVGLSTWPLYAEIEEEDDGAGPTEGPLRILMNATAGQLSSSFLEDLSNAIRKGMVATLTLRGDDPEDELTTEILSDRFKAAGLNLSTVERHSLSSSLEALLVNTDVLVDSTPIPDPESAILALKLGVPVLAQEPNCAQNGATVSLLYSVGLSDWIASDRDSFSDLLAELSKSPDTFQQRKSFVRAAVNKASGLEERIRRGKAFTELFDTLLAKAAEEEQ